MTAAPTTVTTSAPGARSSDPPPSEPIPYRRRMGVRLDESDEYMHELGPEPNFNESMYFNFFDREKSIGGFVRLGNRAKEGQAEMTVRITAINMSH